MTKVPSRTSYAMARVESARQRGSLLQDWNVTLKVHIIDYMKAMLIELDDEVAAKLEKVAPGRTRRRSEFIRMAVRRALWDLEEQATAEAYRRVPEATPQPDPDPAVWEPRTQRRRRVRR